MKKLLTILFVLFSFALFAQDIVPLDTAYHSLPTYSFKYYTKDSSVWIQKGIKYGTTKLVSNRRLKFLIDSINGAYVSKNQTIPDTIKYGSPVVEGFQFDTTPTKTNVSEGLLRWNATDGTLDLGQGLNGIVTQQIGQELFVKVVNKTGVTISEGKAVYFDGRLGNRPKIALSKSDNELTSKVVGIVTEDIANDAEGYITTFGYVRKIKTDYAG